VRATPLRAAALLFAAACSAQAEAILSARFLGNEAVEIADGATTLLTDFPYKSGAFGYMRYDAAELRPRKDALCLISHGHDDHFDADLVAKVGCRVYGPPDVLARVPKPAALGGSPPIAFGDLKIRPVKTDHAGIGHFSYLVLWKGLRLYFTGDTDEIRELSSQGRLDALFISPWLLEAARKANALPDAKRIVVYHHRAGETQPTCPSCLVPRQGEVIDLK
jgi:L-ascorbate metabolism protein UlaG (beta-lactamase superfamily)